MKKNRIIEDIITFMAILLLMLFYSYITQDEIWNFGFSYNISMGLIPYKDFNMVITPLYPYIASLFLIIFGKKLIVFIFFNTILIFMIFTSMKKYHKKNYYLIYIIMIVAYYTLIPTYNLLCLLLLYIILIMEEKHRNDYLIGIILGIIFLTKQNVGILLCIPTLFTKDIKKIIKRIIGFMIPIAVLLLYLILNNNIHEFIDYTILGLADFREKNTRIHILVIINIISILYLIYKYWKTKKTDIIYLISFQLISYPLFDLYHLTIGIIPTIGYILSNLKLSEKVLKKSYYLVMAIILIITGYNILNNKISIINSSSILNYRTVQYKESLQILNEVSDYLKNSSKHTFIIDGDAYIYKLNTGIKINKYDLLNNGNLGKNGEKKIIKDFERICKKEECTFLVYDEKIEKDMQLNKEIIKYIKNNYTKEGNIYYIGIYKN